MISLPGSSRFVLGGVVAVVAGGTALLLASATMPPARAAPPAPTITADHAHPAVIELYQSQGCSDCPPALAVLRIEADRPELIALSFAVTYWDQLGWKDRFAQPGFTQRQWDYAHANRRPQVATPQVVVNGRGFVNGGDRSQLDQALARYDRGRSGPEITPVANGVQIGAAAARAPATIWVVDYDPRTIAVPIGAGENSGRTLPHRNIVRAITAAGDWSGTARTVPLPPRASGVARAVLVQQGKGGPIIAARALG